MKNFISFLIVFSFSMVYSQQQGFWDKDRATSREIKYSAGQRIIVKTENFPVGTTEVLYRITLLDDKQQLASSLTSLLKAIPDPSGISQGSAGAVFILSKVSGEDKCKYAIFSNDELAKKYTKDGLVEKACLYQNQPISKDAKLLTADKSSCLSLENQNLWFGFENDNWIMNQKIILEVVPWVNFRLSQGWNTKNRKSILDLVKTSSLAKKMINSDDLSLCILEKIQNKYSFQEYNKLLAIEKTKLFKDFGNLCLTDKSLNTSILETVRSDASAYFTQKKYAQAIDLLLNAVINRNSATINDYYNLGTYYLYSKQYEKATKTLKDGEKIDASELLIQLQLANVYVLTNNFGEAKKLHKQYKSQNVTPTTSWVEKAKSEIESLRKAGLDSKNFDKILEILED